MLGLHVPSGMAEAFTAYGRAPEEQNTTDDVPGSSARYTDWAAKYPWVLVMSAGERSLHDVCAKERVAGHDFDAVRVIMQQVAQCLSYMPVQPHNLVYLCGSCLALLTPLVNPGSLRLTLSRW